MEGRVTFGETYSYPPVAISNAESAVHDSAVEELLLYLNPENPQLAECSAHASIPLNAFPLACDGIKRKRR